MIFTAEDWSPSAGQKSEALMDGMFGESFDNLDQAKKSYNENDVAGASAAVGMAAVGMVDPTRRKNWGQCNVYLV